MATSEHICIDAVGVVHGGAASILRALIAQLEHEHPQADLTVWCSPARALRFEPSGGPRVAWLERPIEHDHLPARVVWLTRALASASQRRRATQLYTLNGCALAPQLPTHALVQQGLLFNSQAAATLSPTMRARLAVLRRLLHRALPHATTVTVHTPWLADALLTENLTTRERLSVAPSPQTLCPERAPLPPAWYAIPPHARCLYLGNDLPYKDLATAARGVRIARRDPACRDLTLITAGPIDRPLPDALHLGLLTPPQVHEALATAACLIQPSSCESLGLPVVEALTAGCPVLVADHPWSRHVAGEQARFFTPGSAHDVAFALRALRQADPNPRPYGHPLR